MNKLDLIQTLATTTDISKTEATKIVNLFFEPMATALERVIGLKSGVCSLFMSRNIRGNRPESENWGDG